MDRYTVVISYFGEENGRSKGHHCLIQGWEEAIRVTKSEINKFEGKRILYIPYEMYAQI